MNPLWKIGSENLVQKLCEVGRTKTFRIGEEIFAEGDVAEFLPIVINGKVKVVRFLD